MRPRAISLPDFFDVVPRSNVTTPTKSTLEMQKQTKENQETTTTMMKNLVGRVCKEHDS